MERPSKSCARVSTSTVCLQRVTQRLPGVVGAVKYCYHPPHGPVSGRLWEWSRYPSPTHNFNLRPCECSYCQIGERVFVTAWSWLTTLQLPCWNFVWEWFETGNQRERLMVLLVVCTCARALATVQHYLLTLGSQGTTVNTIQLDHAYKGFVGDTQS